MKYTCYLGWFLLIFLIVSSGCNSQKGSSIDSPSHHTPSGFQNNYLPPERMTKDLSKHWSRFCNRVIRQPESLRQIQPQIGFLKNNRTESTLT